ncbi:MAG: glutathione S-transferase family protein, partial [Gammaproteobacteria bacterium]
MKFYDCKTAPSPRRARIFIAEKGLDIETIEVDLANQAQLSDEFQAINPRCTVPVLELDDGTTIVENIGIAVYLEAAYPEPNLLGANPLEKGLVSTWNARIEYEGLIPTADALRNGSKRMSNRAITGPTNYAQIPDLAERGLDRCREFFAMLDTRLEQSEFIAGGRFTLADITA